jgi:hypothetical protein
VTSTTTDTFAKSYGRPAFTMDVLVVYALVVYGGARLKA